jgi:hypothetical protein
MDSEQRLEDRFIWLKDLIVLILIARNDLLQIENPPNSIGLWIND